MRLVMMACGFALAMTAPLANAAPTPATPAVTPAGKVYSINTTQLGTLLGDPAAKAVLMKHIPEVITRMGDNLEQAQGMTLKEMQDALKAYAPDVLSDQKLAAIDLDLAKIPAK